MKSTNYVIVLNIDIETSEVEAVVRGKEDPSRYLPDFRKWFTKSRKEAHSASRAYAFAKWLVKNKGYKLVEYSVIEVNA